ncbi:uncharacterized protein B0H64DRAFT_459171 [Chaetomium fimeti]|uniref:Nephrocystin 3-like N-terminal domain-containing protein n=1 Tax=Chaetomium fimeti TaxID=1854472 RepID=A0AAE0HEU9_9PEZI|nr:hypothetical protein B0H64DRAFT_459171 [Chaetomium fimeti]
MDPVSALSVAASVVGFLDTAQKVLFEGRGRLQDSSELAQIHDTLEIVNQMRLNSTNDELSMIADDAGGLVADLQGVLRAKQALKPDESAWERVAYSDQERFDEIQASPRFAELDAYSKAAVTALLAQGKSNLTTEEETHYLTSAGELINRVLGPGNNGEPDREREFAIRREADGAVLRLLQYGAMDRRKDDIEPTFGSSFQWIFEEPVNERWTNFPEWMADGSGLYLITGKEASGKSTLMKYISTQPQTTPAPGLKSQEEGLLRSLLYSILHQQPHLMPNVFPNEWSMFYASASNDRNPSSAGLGAWRVDHLRDAFRRLVKQDQSALKLFFLIDGIDEYQHEDGKDNFTEIIEFFKNEVVTSPSIKALVSSRPLEALDKLGIQPQLTLHDLNREDIRSYVNKTLNKDDLLPAANELDEQTWDSIILYIVENSNGVFLWAVLSVRAVLSKLADGETVSKILDDLKRRAMPMLDDLYRRMWSAIPVAVRRHASQAALVMLARTDMMQNGSDNGEGAPRLWKCNKLAKDFTTAWPGFITTTAPEDGGPDWSLTSTIRYCHRSVPDYLRKESASILADAVDPMYLFPGRFCPRTALLKSAVQQLKCVPLRTPRQYLWAFVTTALLAANEIESKHDRTQGLMWRYAELLAELDRTMQHHHDNLQRGPDFRYLETKLQDPHGIVGVEDRGRDSKRIAKMHWANFHFDPECAHQRSWEDSFLTLAIQFGLQNYVGAKLGKGLKSKKGRPLLDYALVPLAKIAPYDLVKPALVETLLDQGADPNERFEGRTCWERALQWQYETYPSAVNAIGARLDDARRVAEDRVKIFQLLIDKKADKRAFIVTPKGKKISARRVLNESFKAWPNEKPLQGFKRLIDSFPKDDTEIGSGTFLFTSAANT